MANNWQTFQKKLASVSADVRAGKTDPAVLKALIVQLTPYFRKESIRDGNHPGQIDKGATAKFTAAANNILSAAAAAVADGYRLKFQKTTTAPLGKPVGAPVLKSLPVAPAAPASSLWLAWALAAVGLIWFLRSR